MYPIERYLMRLKSYVHNKAQPEGSIVEGYVKDECITFCSRYFEDVETVFNRPPRNDENIPGKEMYMLNSGGRKIGKVETIELDIQTIGAMHDNSYHPSPSSQPRETLQPSYFQANQPSFLSTSNLHDPSLSSSSCTHNQSSDASFSHYLESEHAQVDEEVTKLLTHVEIIDEQGNVLRTQKMSIKDVAKLKAGEKILVPFNEFDQPIRAAEGLCTRYMTILLRQLNLCPPEARDWKEL